MKQKIIISGMIIIMIFLGIKFLPGFNFGGKLAQENELPDKTKESSSVPTTSQEKTDAPQPVEEKGGEKEEEESEEKEEESRYTIKSASLLSLDKSIESSHFKVYFHSTGEKAAAELITAAEKDYPSFPKFFKALPKTEILITDDANEYINVFNAAPPWGRDAYQDPNISAGAFCPGCTTGLADNTEYIYMLRPRSSQSFAHELSHRYFWANYPNLRNDNYNWINEGLAVYVQNEISPGPGGFSSENLASFRNFTLPDNLEELKELQQKGDYQSLERFYDAAGLLAVYISQKNQDYGLQDFLTDLNNTKDVEKTCQNNFGFGLDQLLKNWKAAITQTLAENPVDFLEHFKKKI